MIRKLVTWVSTIALLIILSTGLAYWQAHDNFHVIIPHKFYRSAQLNPLDLTQAINNYHIKAILNLRGKNPSRRWYQQEIKTAKNYKLQHYDIALQSTVLPNQTQLKKLVSILLTSPKPLLVHCEGGADRTGLAASIVMLLHNKSVTTAKQQISWHFWVIKPRSVGYQFIPNYQAWLIKHQYAHSNKQHFLQYVSSYKG